jgi:hypothetical protein
MSNNNDNQEEYLYDEGDFNEEDYINEGFEDGGMESLNHQSEEHHESDNYHMEEDNEQERDEMDTEPIYEMTLEIEGQPMTIKVYSDSNPEELAYEFCREHNLDINALRYLAGELTTLIQKYKSKEGDNRMQNDEIVEVEEENNITDKRGNESEEEHIIDYDHNNTSEEGIVHDTGRQTKQTEDVDPIILPNDYNMSRHTEDVEPITLPNDYNMSRQTEYVESITLPNDHNYIEEEKEIKSHKKSALPNKTARNQVQHHHNGDPDEINVDRYGHFFGEGEFESRNAAEYSKKESTPIKDNREPLVEHIKAEPGEIPDEDYDKHKKQYLKAKVPSRNENEGIEIKPSLSAFSNSQSNIHKSDVIIPERKYPGAVESYNNFVIKESYINKDELYKKYSHAHEEQDNEDKYGVKKQNFKREAIPEVTNIIKDDYKSLNYNYVDQHNTRRDNTQPRLNVQPNTRRDDTQPRSNEQHNIRRNYPQQTHNDQRNIRKEYAIPQPIPSNDHLVTSDSNREFNKYKRNSSRPKETIRTETEENVEEHLKPARRQSFDYKESENVVHEIRNTEERKHQMDHLPSNFFSKSLNSKLLSYDSPTRMGGRNNKLFINDLVNNKPNNVTSKTQSSFFCGSPKVFSSKNINVNEKQNIFEKLYKEASHKRLNKKKLINEINSSRNDPVETSSFKPKHIDKTINYGERLYNREKHNKEKKLVKFTQIKAEDYIKHNENNTFSPKISKYVIKSIIF